MTILHNSLKLQSIISNLTPFKLFIYSYSLLELFIVIPYLRIVHYFNINTGGFDFGNKNRIIVFFTAIIFIPLLETLIFQTLIISLIKKRYSKSNRLTIIISAIFFGLNHPYSFAYIIYTFFIGVVFAYVYILAQEKKFNAFIIVFSIHGIHNLTMHLI